MCSEQRWNGKNRSCCSWRCTSQGPRHGIGLPYVLWRYILYLDEGLIDCLSIARGSTCGDILNETSPKTSQRYPSSQSSLDPASNRPHSIAIGISFTEPPSKRQSRAVPSSDPVKTSDPRTRTSRKRRARARRLSRADSGDPLRFLEGFDQTNSPVSGVAWLKPPKPRWMWVCIRKASQFDPHWKDNRA